MYLLNIALLLLVPGSLSVLGLLVYLNNPKGATNKLFLLMAASSAASAAGVYAAELSSSSEAAFFWVKFTMVAASWASPLIFLLVYNFPRDKFIISRWIIAAEVALASFFSFAAVTNLLYSNITYTPNGNLQQTLGPILPLFGIAFLAHLIAGGFRLFKKIKKSIGIEKEQFKYLAYGIILMLIFVGVFDISFILILGINAFTGLGVVSFLFFEGAIYYSITHHRLLDIRLVVARTVAYSLMATVLFAVYATTAVIITSVFLKTPTRIEQLALFSVLTVIVAFTFQPLKSLLEKITDNIFFKDRYDSSKLLTSLTKIMATTLGLEKLTEKLVIKMLPNMRISKGAFVLLEKGKVSNVINMGFTEKIKFTTPDILALLETEKVLTFDELKNEHLKTIMRDLSINVSVPLKVSNEEHGVLLLGHKLSGEIYSTQDIKLLEILAPEISIALQNAKAYEEIKQFNIKLAKEVERATSDLVHANEKLKELDKLKDEFMSIASHELRTPMTAIKSYVWLALHGKTQEKDRKVRVYLDKVFESSERMISMINDMLNVNRIETGRMKLDIIPVSVWKVAEQVKDELSARAAESGLELIIKKDNIVPLVMSDKDKLIEIFTNLIGNALKFTQKGGKITVSAQKAGTMAEIQVSDNGVGIDKKNLDKLFKKYGKLNESYATVSPSTGTGLGLYITRQYLEKMGGKIGVESTKGKGTTFTFSLPIAAGKDLQLHAKEEIQPSGVILNPKLAKDPKFQKAVVEAEISRTTKKKS